MGFFASGSGAGRKRSKEPSVELMHRLQCRICPLDKLKDNLHPHIKPQGSDHPDVYILGEAPGKAEDRHNKHFWGDSGQILRDAIPDEWQDVLRWNNVVRTRPPGNRDPEPIEVECCRPSVAGDISQSKPKAIFGFGNVPLHWMGLSGSITTWRGRRVPVSINGHECWFFPIGHPAAILHEKNDFQKENLHRVFKFDLRNAFAAIEYLPEPEVHDREVVNYGIEFAYGAREGDLKRVEGFLKWAMKQEEVGLDLETKRFRPYAADAKILTVAIAKGENSFAFALEHRQAKWKPHELARIHELFELFLRSTVRKIAHFVRFEMEWLAYRYGWELCHETNWGGTESQAAVIDERSGAMSLEFLVQQYFGFDLKGLSLLDKFNLDDEPIEDVLWYNAGDAKYHYLLWLKQREVLKRRKFEYLYEEMIARVPTAVLTQLKGIKSEPEETERLYKKYGRRKSDALADIAEEPEVAQFERRFKDKRGKALTFKPLSDDHCVMMFRDMLKCPEGRTDGDKYSVDEETLKAIGLPVCKSIIRLRKANKILSTYVYKNNEEKRKIVVWPDGKIHPNFNTVKVRTKRLSADDPNVQNIPKRDEQAKEVRKQVGAPAGKLCCSIDYGQIQARGIAMSSQDKTFCKSLWERFDVHAHWAERIARAYPPRVDNVTNFKDEAGKKVLKKFRGDIKNQWTFPLFFGATLRKVSAELSIPEDIVRPEFKAFQKMFEGVFEWHERLIKFYNDNGYVEDLFGFRHNAPLSINEIINSPIQSLEALFVMRAMNRLSQHATRTDDYNYQPFAQIHDDLSFFFPEKNVDTYVEHSVTEMLGVTFPFVNVPMTLEVSIGPNLMDMKECLVASSDDWRVAT